jgi:hypothetical protein
MPNSDKIISKFLLELHSKEVSPMFESLTFLLEYLENKEDPDPEEMRIVESAYQALEKLQTLEALLKQRVRKTHPPTGTRLQELYDKAPTSVGSQVLFKI